MLIQTTKGPLDESTLTRSLILHDRPTGLALWIEWRIGDALEGELVRRDAFPIALHRGSKGDVFTTRGYRSPASLRREVALSENEDAYIVKERFYLKDELVSESPSVIVKQPSTVATAMAGAFA